MNTIPIPIVPYLVSTAYAEALKNLLEKKNLYQSIEADFKSAGAKYVESISDDAPSPRAMATVIGSSPPTPEQHWEAQLRQYRHAELIVNIPNVPKPAPLGHVPQMIQPITFDLPTILINCQNCKNVFPAHNPGYGGLKEQTRTLNLGTGDKGMVQVFTFPYQCQSCKKEPLVFTVRRVGSKLTLVGRSHLFKTDIPKTIPDEERDYLNKAILANGTGNTLAGLFLLRVFIEQYMRRVTNTKERIRGDDLADKYAVLLNDEFPKSIRSFKNLYEDLSICIHGADPSVERFDEVVKHLYKHFAQLEILPLRGNPITAEGTKS